MGNKIGEEEGEVWLPLSDMLLALILIFVTAGTGLFITSGLFHYRPDGAASSGGGSGGQGNQTAPAATPGQGGVVIPNGALNFQAPYYQFQEQESRFEEVAVDSKLCRPYSAGEKMFKDRIKIKMDLSKDSISGKAALDFIRKKMDEVKTGNNGRLITEIRVEAQASPGWGNAPGAVSAICNMSLSILRAWKVYEMIMNMAEWTPEERTFLQQRLVPHPAGATAALRDPDVVATGKGGAGNQELERYRSVSLRVVYADGTNSASRVN